MGCKSSKVKPKRDEAKEIEEREKAAREKKEKEEAEAKAAAEAEQKATADEAVAVEEEPEPAEEAGEPMPEPETPDDMGEQAEPMIMPDEVGSVGTMSIAQEGSAVMATEETKTQTVKKITVASHAGAAMITGRSVTPCDMTVVDQVAKYVSTQCGCDLNELCDENLCPICVNMDLSDAPLLN